MSTPNDDLANHILFLERREAELAAEVASLPTRGTHRKQWLKVHQELARVRETLKDSREWLRSQAEAETELEAHLASMTPEERAYFDKMYAEYEAYEKANGLDWESRRRREREAEGRREGFRLIWGGKSE